LNTNELFLSQLVKAIDLRLFTPSLYRYIKDYLEIEKVRRYADQFVINSFIPPFPGAAFDRFLSTFFEKGKITPIQSADMAVTNACMFNCWHCYNADRRVEDLSAGCLQNIVRQLQDSGAIVINFSGGEPCLRHDLPEICSSLRDDSCGILATTGYGFSDEVARGLRDTHIYSICISLDSADEKEHDGKRGVRGAFRIALRGIKTAKKYGFYTYTCAVPSKKLLEEENFRRLVELNESLGVDELQLLEPMPAGKILSAAIDFGEKEYEKVFQYMSEYNQREDGVAISSFSHMESPDFFGCGAGYTHIYVDGTGEVSPCNLMPVSYGNAEKEDIAAIVARMQSKIKQPYRVCLAQSMQHFFRKHAGNVKPVSAAAIPPLPLPEDKALPGFFQMLEDSEKETTGKEEIVKGYDEVSSSYEDYWLSVASRPIDEMFEKLEIRPGAGAIECGCGTGYSTARLAKGIGDEGKVTAIDLSPRMIEQAKRRTRESGLSNIEFRVADVLEELKRMPPASFDAAVLTWIIGYVGCDEIFPLLKKVLKPGGLLGYVAHLDHSPLAPIEVFEEIVQEEPESLMKAVRTKFPKDMDETEEQLKAAGFKTHWIRKSTFDFVCHKGREVYDHVMKSGAGTTFYYALKPSARERLAKKFIRRIDRRYEGAPKIKILHEYISGIAVSKDR